MYLYVRLGFLPWTAVFRGLFAICAAFRPSVRSLRRLKAFLKMTPFLSRCQSLPAASLSNFSGRSVNDELVNAFGRLRLFVFWFFAGFSTISFRTQLRSKCAKSHGDNPAAPFPLPGGIPLSTGKRHSRLNMSLSIFDRLQLPGHQGL